MNKTERVLRKRMAHLERKTSYDKDNAGLADALIQWLKFEFAPEVSKNQGWDPIEFQCND